jgi:DoxX-like family
MSVTSRSGTFGSSRLWRWVAWTMTALFTLFMVFDTTIKLMQLPIVEEANTQLGYPPGMGFPIGVLEVFLLVLYLVPRTSILGAVLFTGLFGGTVATHLRAGSPLFSHMLFGVYLGVLAWGGLWLRDEKLRALFPVRRQWSYPDA